MDIVEVPNKVLYDILTFLPPGEVMKSCQNNIVLSRICNDDSFWRRKFYRDFPLDETVPMPSGVEGHKHLYFLMAQKRLDNFPLSVGGDLVEKNVWVYSSYSSNRLAYLLLEVGLGRIRLENVLIFLVTDYETYELVHEPTKDFHEAGLERKNIVYSDDGLTVFYINSQFQRNKETYTLGKLWKHIRYFHISSYPDIPKDTRIKLIRANGDWIRDVWCNVEDTITDIAREIRVAVPSASRVSIGTYQYSAFNVGKDGILIPPFSPPPVGEIFSIDLDTETRTEIFHHILSQPSIMFVGTVYM